MATYAAVLAGNIPHYFTLKFKEKNEKKIHPVKYTFYVPSNPGLGLNTGRFLSPNTLSILP